ncbi:MAG: type II secretion system F family protein [Candidatus Omnitrophica bacterium]|nr:type II secretion system F family protein [Candidatus Omnitrophota bacterium]
MLTGVLLLAFVSVGFIALTVIPIVEKWLAVASATQEQQLMEQMEPLMAKQKAKKMGYLFIMCPLVLGGAGYYFFPDLAMYAVPIGIGFGIICPYFIVKSIIKRNQDKFQDQLIDALLIMSSSFRGGLSLVQALEAVVEEMPDPIQSEFGLVLAENKMGVSLEDAMQHLFRRMPSIPLQQMITAILLARETGGNLPIIFGRIVNNIRERKKVRQNLDTLTIQGKIQGVVMTALPVGFAFIVYSTDRRVFDHMLKSPLGQKLLIAAFILWVVGAFMIWKISKFDDF